MLDLLKTHQDGYTDPSLAAMDELCMDFCVKGIQFLFFIDRCCLHDEEEEGKLTVCSAAAAEMHAAGVKRFLRRPTSSM